MPANDNHRSKISGTLGMAGVGIVSFVGVLRVLAKRGDVRASEKLLDIARNIDKLFDGVG